MKRLSKVLVVTVLLSLLVIAISPSLVGAAGAVKPVRYTEVTRTYEVDEVEGTVTVGVRRVNMLHYPVEQDAEIMNVVSMNMAINLRVYSWDAATGKRGDLLMRIKINESLSGEVYKDIWFPEGPDGGLTIDEGVINGHVVLKWQIKAYSDELPDEILDNLRGKYDLWFEDGVELGISTRVGEFPFAD